MSCSSRLCTQEVWPILQICPRGHQQSNKGTRVWRKKCRRCCSRIDNRHATIIGCCCCVSYATVRKVLGKSGCYKAEKMGMRASAAASGAARATPLEFHQTTNQPQTSRKQAANKPRAIRAGDTAKLSRAEVNGRQNRPNTTTTISKTFYSASLSHSESSALGFLYMEYYFSFLVP